jgi:hypothetical protein
MNLEEFESQLRAVTGEADPVPELVLDAGRAAFATRTIDAELAELVADSAYGDSGLVTRAVVSDVRMLSFECGQVTVELDVETDPSTRSLRLHGIAVGALGDVVLVRASGRQLVALDHDGRFDAGTIGAGPLRLELTTPDGRRVTTSWVSV